MSEVTGVEEILKNMEDKLGKARVNRISNKALKNKAKETSKLLKNTWLVISIQEKHTT